METKLVNLVPLNGTNYATWKVQCKMALIRDCVWNIVNGTEIIPDSRIEMGLYAKYLSRKDRALATIVLSLEPLPRPADKRKQIRLHARLRTILSGYGRK